MSNSRVVEYTLAAGEYVRRAIGVELDGTVESLAFVDHYLSQVGDAKDELLPLIVAAIGAYFGEVLITRFGGEWLAESPNAADWIITLEAAPIAVHPIAMAAEAVRHDEVEGYDGTLRIAPLYEATVVDALAGAGPVEEDYYYSLTGRLETIEHVTEIIAELRHLDEQKREEADAPKLVEADDAPALPGLPKNGHKDSN